MVLDLADTKVFGQSVVLVFVPSGQGFDCQ
jgi:hypothetical protein